MTKPAAIDVCNASIRALVMMHIYGQEAFLVLTAKGLAAAGVDVSALWWAVIFGAGFGGNATSIGSSANIVIISLSQCTRTPITPRFWTRRDLPVAVATCIMGSILFALAFQWLGRYVRLSASIYFI